MQVETIEVDRKEARLRRMRRGTLTSARLLRDAMQPRGFRIKWAFLTLTYAPQVLWRPRHVSELLKRIRQWMQRRGSDFRYVWVAELTKAGRLHYHVMISLPRGLTLPKPDKQGWWPWGSTKIEWARRVVGYMAKYCSKGSADDTFPKGARIAGVGGLTAEAAREKRWWLSPSYVRDAFGPEASPSRCFGGGWVDRVSGEWIPSRWRLLAIGPRYLRLIPADAQWQGPQARNSSCPDARQQFAALAELGRKFAQTS